MRGGLIGSPETIRKKLRRIRTSHIGQVILLNQAGKNSHEHICESLELFAKEVMPEFRSDPEHEAWKAGVMSGDIQLEEIDTQAFTRSEEHTSELQSPDHLVCRLLLEK